MDGTKGAIGRGSYGISSFFDPPPDRAAPLYASAQNARIFRRRCPVNGRQATAAAHPPAENRLLAALPAADLERLRPHLEPVPMPLGLTLYEAGRRMTHVYFPTEGIVSLLYVMENGASAEIAVTGNEGLVGVSLFMGGESTPSTALVQSAGHAYGLGAKTLKREFERGGELQHLLLRYTQALITQMAQTAVCNRHHSVEQQLCRWLLLSLDRLPSNRVHMTQELIANMLGVRREGVTEAAGKLQHAGVIRYRRGHITVLDRGGLERQVCECYAVVKKEFSRLLPDALQRRDVSSPPPTAQGHSVADTTSRARGLK
jgi:CRP-like cAMP-binding protein